MEDINTDGKRAVWDYDPLIEVDRPLEDVVPAVWHAITRGVLAEDGDIAAFAGDSLPGLVEWRFEHRAAGPRWGRLAIRRESAGVTLLEFIGPEFLPMTVSEDLPRAEARKATRRRHDWRVALWSCVVSEIMDWLVKAFGTTGSGSVVEPAAGDATTRGGPGKKPKGAKRIEERDDWSKKLLAVDKWEWHMRSGKSEELAAQLVGYQRSTLQRWRNRRNACLPKNA